MANRYPWIKFVCGDWLKDPNLGRCSREARGFWIDALCVLHEAEEVGVFITNGIPWTDQEIAGAVRGDEAGNLRCLAEVLAKGVAARTKSGAVFSRRMVRDEEKRKKCQEAGKAGGNPALVRPTLKGRVKGEVKPPVKREVNRASDSDFSEVRVGSEVDIPFSLSSVEEKKVPEKRRTELEVRIDEVAKEMTARHPKRRSCGPAEARKLLGRIVQRVPAAERLSILSQVAENHAAWCNSPEWKKDNGEYAKALANWLAPTEERYRVAPKSDDDEVYYSYARGF